MRNIFRPRKTNSKNSPRNHGRSGHAPGHLRDALIANSSDQHLLDWFLKWTDDESESRLGFLARQIAAEPFNADVFSNELTTKLTRLRYPQPDREVGIGKETFYAILERAGLLPLILQEQTLHALWKHRLLKDLFQKDSELREKHLSVEGILLSEHRRRVRRVQRDLSTLERIAREYGLERYMAESYEKMEGEILKVRRPILTSEYPGSKSELLLGRPAKELSSDVRSEDTVIQANIYLTLKQRLQTSETPKRGVSDIFLCQMAELVCARPDVRGLSNGETIRKMANRLTKLR
jgi:hypothetical protein